MRTIKIIVVSFFLFFAVLASSEVSAQCSMCTLNAENSVRNGNTEGNGLNNGILYLLAAPYLAIACVGVLWYKKYRRKNVVMHMKEGRINLN